MQGSFGGGSGSGNRRTGGRFEVVASLLVTLALGACGRGGSGCVNQELERSAAPDGSRFAVVYVRACGATTGPGVQVSVLSPGQEIPDEPGNVLAIKDPAAAAEKRGDVGIRWTGPRELRVSYASGRGVSRARTAFEDVRVTFDVR